MSNFFGYGFGFHGIGMFLFWGLIILIVYWTFKEDYAVSKINKKAIEILDERYARGEIDKGEFHQKKKELIA
ncbi:MAG: SHOCT domain-containing protein [gamma proteobacterium symbiont of Taylorina sp.]|nr:SHOCT domain-containing protein [gamma proteobacterium symbiont of Taylorina sp.]